MRGRMARRPVFLSRSIMAVRVRPGKRPSSHVCQGMRQSIKGILSKSSSAHPSSIAASRSSASSRRPVPTHILQNVSRSASGTSVWNPWSINTSSNRAPMRRCRKSSTFARRARCSPTAAAPTPKLKPTAARRARSSSARSSGASSFKAAAATNRGVDRRCTSMSMTPPLSAGAGIGATPVARCFFGSASPAARTMASPAKKYACRGSKDRAKATTRQTANKLDRARGRRTQPQAERKARTAETALAKYSNATIEAAKKFPCTRSAIFTALPFEAFESFEFARTMTLPGCKSLCV
mmetsp:Transcript_8748/g.28778  ORF Transcript_8748/g.28778 Transcript_8748/m.28778 type:complete len:295 (+) Transcript_8748:1629-2513(+)